MDSLPGHPPAPPPGYTQPCNEACAYHQPVPGDDWSEFVLCRHPQAPQRGMPARLGRECRWFTPLSAENRGTP